MNRLTRSIGGCYLKNATSLWYSINSRRGRKESSTSMRRLWKCRGPFSSLASAMRLRDVSLNLARVPCSRLRIADIAFQACYRMADRFAFVACGFCCH